MRLAEAHILLVDDEPILRMTLGLLLRRKGATVTEAGNGEEALLALQHGSIDLLLTDQAMPVMNGLALLQAAAATQIGVPSILCAGAHSDEDDAVLATLGVQATLLKPFSPPELINLLKAVLSHVPKRT